jgi:NO-binding membrane sensor protein with MHYT domain
MNINLLTSIRLSQLAISVSFGLVAIWCMHFVGNRAIILGNGDKGIQLYYNPGFTALSAFLPIIFLFCGLTTVEVRRPGQRFFWPALVVAGVVAGLAITGMHYVGNFGISNYHLHFPAGYIVGAAAIAICASIAALILFFYFKERWINSLPRRLGCSCLLAGAVSGMHWVASVGTTYTLQNATPDAASDGRDTTLIVAIVIVSLKYLNWTDNHTDTFSLFFVAWSV